MTKQHKSRPIRIFNEKKDPYILIKISEIDKALLELLKKYIENVSVNSNHLKIKLAKLPEDILFQLMTQPIHKKKKQLKKIEKKELIDMFAEVVKNPPKQSRKRGRIPRPTPHNIMPNYLEKKERKDDMIKNLEKKIAILEKDLKSKEEVQTEKLLNEILNDIKTMNKEEKKIAINLTTEKNPQIIEKNEEISTKKSPRLERSMRGKTLGELMEGYSLEFSSDDDSKSSERSYSPVDKKIAETERILRAPVEKRVQRAYYHSAEPERQFRPLVEKRTSKAIELKKMLTPFKNKESGEGGDYEDDEGLSDEQLNSIMSAFPNYYGCVTNDDLMDLLEEVKRDKPERFYFFYLKNRHWISIYCDFNEKEIDYYDSFGRSSEKQFRDKFKSLFQGMKVEYMMKWKDNHIVSQGDSDLCGIYAMWFLVQRLFGFPFKEATDWSNIKENEKRFSQARINFGFV